MDWQSLQHYASFMGWPLFPCRASPETLPNGEVRKAKTPLTPNGFKTATTNLIALKQWYIRPAAN
jgi:hypothetical protein